MDSESCPLVHSAIPGWRQEKQRPAVSSRAPSLGFTCHKPGIALWQTTLGGALLGRVSLALLPGENTQTLLKAPSLWWLPCLPCSGGSRELLHKNKTWVARAPQPRLALTQQTLELGHMMAWVLQSGGIYPGSGLRSPQQQKPPGSSPRQVAARVPAHWDKHKGGKIPVPEGQVAPLLWHAPRFHGSHKLK